MDYDTSDSGREGVGEEFRVFLLVLGCIRSVSTEENRDGSLESET